MEISYKSFGRIAISLILVSCVGFSVFLYGVQGLGEKGLAETFYFAFAPVIILIAIIIIKANSLIRDLKKREKEKIPFLERASLIEPRDPEIYRGVFANARGVCAYNPPLDLLVNSADHRKVLVGLLSRGVKCLFLCDNAIEKKQLGLLRDKIKEKIKDTLYQNLTCRNSGEDINLYTVVKPWPQNCGKKMNCGSREKCKHQTGSDTRCCTCGEKCDSKNGCPFIERNPPHCDVRELCDVRGLSFFLIREELIDTVLLYPYGLLDSSFEAPKYAILIRGPHKGNALYTELKETYKERWKNAKTESNGAKAEDALDNEQNTSDNNRRILEPWIQKCAHAKYTWPISALLFLAAMTNTGANNPAIGCTLIGISLAALVLPAIPVMWWLMKVADTYHGLHPVQDGLSGDIAGNVALFAPTKHRDFRKIWSGASRVRAYNPPLNLLLDPDFRSEINALLERRFEYQVIVGEESAKQLKKCYTAWEGEGQGRINSLSKVRVKSHSHTKDLHSYVSPWNLDKEDWTFHGLSFFLIEKDDENCELILYPLGRPFSKGFIAPDHGIRVTAPRDNSLYSIFGERFDEVWKKNEAFDEFCRGQDGLALPTFIEKKFPVDLKTGQNVGVSPSLPSVLPINNKQQPEDEGPTHDPGEEGAENGQDMTGAPPAEDDGQKTSGESSDNKESKV